MRDFNTDRRRLLKTTGATIAASFLAGCGGGGNGGDDGGDGSGDGGSSDKSPTQVAVDWVTGSTGSHPGSSNFGGEGDIMDMTGQGSVTIENGNQPSGKYVFAPAVAKVSTGTEVTWQWTSGPHTVTKLEGNGATLTGWSGTGMTTLNQGESRSATFDSAGVALYYCDPHRASDGQVGAIIVE